MDEMFENYSFENDPVLNVLINVVRTHEQYPRILNSKRYREMLIAKEAIDNLLVQSKAEKSEVHLHPTFCSASLTAEIDDLVVQECAHFLIAMSMANNFEIYPLANGRIRMSFTFHNMMRILE